jgi:hypothetical protein
MVFEPLFIYFKLSAMLKAYKSYQHTSFRGENMKSNARTISVLLLFLLLGTGLFVSTASAQYYYTISQNNLNISVNYADAGYVTPGSGSYYYGSTVMARVYTNPGYVFDGWYLNGVYQGKLSTIPITMTQDCTLVAAFSVRTVCLTITNNPSQGGTTAPTAGIWNYTYGSSVTVTEYPNPGCNFSGWYLDGVYQGLGTSITVPMTQDHQLGAFFAGNISLSPPSSESTTTPASPPVNPNLPVPSLSFYCASSTTASGFKVQIEGALVYDLTGISGTGVAFSYSANGGATWHDLAYLITGDEGNFSAVWMPSASGNYIIKGVWLGDDAYSGTSSTVNFSVTPMETPAETGEQDENIFSVSSNSTLSALAFDSTKDEISFTVSGESGTAGYVQACIPKSLMPVVANLKVFLDGHEIPYSTVSQGDIWIIIIGYHHSTHTVVMGLNAQTSSGATGSSSSLPIFEILIALVIVSLLIAVISVTVLLRQRKRLKTNNIACIFAVFSSKAKINESLASLELKLYTIRSYLSFRVLIICL